MNDQLLINVITLCSDLTNVIRNLAGAPVDNREMSIHALRSKSNLPKLVYLHVK